MCMDSEEQALGRHKQICESERGVAIGLYSFVNLLLLMASKKFSEFVSGGCC